MAGSVCLLRSRRGRRPRGRRGECLDEVKGKRGTKPFDSGHRDQWDPRLDGGSTSLIVASRGTPELTAAARPRDQDKGHQDWRSTDLLQAPPGPGGGDIRQLVSGDWHLAASGAWWHLTTGIWRRLALVASDDISSSYFNPSFGISSGK